MLPVDHADTVRCNHVSQPAFHDLVDTREHITTKPCCGTQLSRSEVNASCKPCQKVVCMLSVEMPSVTALNSEDRSEQAHQIDAYSNGFVPDLPHTCQVHACKNGLQSSLSSHKGRRAHLMMRRRELTTKEVEQGRKRGSSGSAKCSEGRHLVVRPSKVAAAGWALATEKISRGLTGHRSSHLRTIWATL